MSARRTSRSLSRSWSVIGVLALAAGCGGGGETPITPVPTTGTVSVTSTPSSFSAAAGASASAGLSITRGGGFAGEVILTSSGAPAGMTIAFAPATLTSAISSSSVTATVGAAVATGAYPVTVVATAVSSGLITSSTTLTITVSPAVTATITQAYCAADAPLWVAYQDGDGPWTRVTAGAANTYAFQIASPRGGIATVDSVGTGFEVEVTYGTATELTAYNSAAGAAACGTKTLTGTIANVGTSAFANVSVGGATTFALGNMSAFQLPNVPDGPQDLVASRVNSSTRRIDKLILRRGVNIPAGGSIPLLDFNAAEAFAPSTANVTVTGLTTDSALIATAYTGTRGSAFGFLAAILEYSSASGAVPYDAIPAANLNAGDLQQIYAIGSTPSTTRFTGVYFRAAADRVLALPPYISTPTVLRATGAPYSRSRTQIDLQPEYNRLLFVETAQASLNRTTRLIATRGWMGGTSWDVTFPDLSAAAGWNNTWAPQAGTPFTWTVTALGGAIFLFDTNVADGATFRSGSINSLQPVP